jgi:hypothetical protein
MLGAQGIWAGRDLYRATLTVTRGLGFSGLIRRTTLYLVASYDTQGCVEDLATSQSLTQSCRSFQCSQTL